MAKRARTPSPRAAEEKRQPAAPDAAIAGRENADTATSPGRPAWLPFAEPDQAEARERCPLLSAALQAWAERAGSRETIESGPTVRIAARREGFRRCGIAHRKTATDHAAERFTPQELEQLLAEPRLTVELV